MAFPVFPAKPKMKYMILGKKQNTMAMPIAYVSGTARYIWRNPPMKNDKIKRPTNDAAFFDGLFMMLNFFE